MKQIVEFTNEAKQIHFIVQENGEQIEFKIEYKPTQQAWYYSLIKNEFEVSGCRLVLGPNVLRRYKNLINFGVMVTAKDKVEPFHINDLVSGRVSIYLLNQTEVEEVELIFYNAG